MSVAALIPASGSGQRMGSDVPKQYIQLQGKPILAWTLDVFQQYEAIDQIVLIVEKNRIKQVKTEIVDVFHFDKVSDVVAGGVERYLSVNNGLSALNENVEWVFVHDAVRPLVEISLMESAFEFAKKKGSAVLSVPIHDTIKAVDQDHKVIKTIDRSSLYLVQTPQIFKRAELNKAYQLGIEKGVLATDEAAMMEMAGFDVFLYPGDDRNIKITTPEDLARAEERIGDKF